MENIPEESSKEEKSQETKNAQDSMDLLEEGLLICQFGRFHVRLLLTTLAAICASSMVTTTTSFILPNAECDLNMSIMQKGLLNSMPFFGQVGSALFTGFITDAFGRRKILVTGFMGIFFCSIIEGCSQNFPTLLFGKFMDGIFLSFCFTTLQVMVSEMVHIKARDRALLLVASFMPLSLIIAALMSWALLPQQWDYVLVEGYFELHSWNIYLYVCSVWSLISGVCYFFFPESPKFLLSHGQEDEALEVLKQIYSINTGNDRDTFPIMTLHTKSTLAIKNKDPFSKQLTNAMFEVRNLFRKPLLGRLVIFSASTFVCLLAYSALRLWYPQISTIVENYEEKHNNTGWFCEMITEYTQSLPQNRGNVSYLDTNLTVNKTEICIPNVSGDRTYINGIILGCISLFGILLSTYIVGLFGHKPLIFSLFLLCASCSSALYWTKSLTSIALLISATCGLMITALSLQQNLLVRVFPTTLRALSMQIIVMIGRIGSLLGSILFPVMLNYGCMVPFWVLSGLSLSVAGLAFLFPNPNGESGGDK